MKILDLLESLSPVLYHLAGFEYSESIINSDTLRSRAGGISFSRSMVGQYGPSHRLQGVMFVLDGVAST